MLWAARAPRSSMSRCCRSLTRSDTAPRVLIHFLHHFALSLLLLCVLRCLLESVTLAFVLT